MLIVILIQCFLGFPSYWKEAAQRQLPPSARSRMPATTDDDDDFDGPDDPDDYNDHDDPDDPDDPYDPDDPDDPENQKDP